MFAMSEFAQNACGQFEDVFYHTLIWSHLIQNIPKDFGSAAAPHIETTSSLYLHGLYKLFKNA